ncbi:hypothetical protein BH18VER1_BH18VER1_06710 [soil metagenome]
MSQPYRLTAICIGLAAVSFMRAADAQQAGSGPGDLAQLHTQGMAAFQSGNFAQAAATLEGLLSKTDPSPQLEPVYYTVGAAYFNANDYAKASAAFKNYQTKFPNGPHAGEVALALAQCSLGTKNYAEAAAQFAALEKDPRFREQALLMQAVASNEGGKAEAAIPPLERLVGAELKSSTAVRGAMLLAQLYATSGSPDKAVKTVVKLHRNVRLVDSIIELNVMTVQLGDQLYGKQRFAEALACYRTAYPKEQIVRMQNERIAAMRKAIEDNLLSARADPSRVMQLGPVANQLKADIARAQQQLEEFGKLPNITPAIYIRLARCFYETDRKWESIVVYQELLDRFPEAPEREPSLFGIIVALADVNQGQRALTRCEEYLREFKDGPNAETVGYLSGAVALQANDPGAAEGYFTRVLETQPKTPFREQIRFLFGNAKFAAGKFDEAAAEYKKYLSDFPKGASVEDVEYRIALTALFSGKYEEAMNGLDAYVKKYPQGTLISDAKYRLAVCKYAASLHDEVIADCKAWQTRFPDDQQLGEVLALMADSYAALDKEEEAIPIYIESYKVATTEEVMNYSLFAASKLLQKRDQWDKVSSLFTEFIQNKPDHPSVLTALYWIGKAKAREGQTDEAKRIMADTIKRYIADPQREPVEMLISQLAQLCAKKKRREPPPEASPAAEPTPDADGASVVAATPAIEPTTASPAPEIDPNIELESLLSGTEENEGPTAKARIIYAKAEIARLRRHAAEEEKHIATIAATFKPEDLSPMLLGRAGDYLLAKQKPDQAQAFYQRLMDEFPKSENVDFAYNGLGEIALAKKELNKALRYFSDGTDKIVASQKLKELTLGKAKTLLALGKLAEAKKVFEQVAAVREWRGEATAFSVYSLGEIEARQGRWAEANAFYQRVYVGYRKFLPWVAKAYMRSAESFEKLGKKEEAANTYRELVRLSNDKKELARFPETIEARKRLEAMGQQG